MAMARNAACHGLIFGAVSPMVAHGRREILMTLSGVPFDPAQSQFHIFPATLTSIYGGKEPA